jgi:hypothetical protein
MQLLQSTPTDPHTTDAKRVESMDESLSDSRLQETSIIGRLLDSRFCSHLCRLDRSSPEVIQSDGAKELTASWLEELRTLVGADKAVSSAYHPQSHTHVERFNFTLANMLSLACTRKDKRDWSRHLRKVEHAWNSVVPVQTGETPYYLTTGYDPVSPVDVVMGKGPKGVAIGEWEDQLHRSRA